METIGAFEAKTHLSALLERVAQGESFTITRHGKPIAQLVPADRTRDQAAIERQLRVRRSSPRNTPLTLIGSLFAMPVGNGEPVLCAGRVGDRRMVLSQ